eukprot:jgi/Botrbrau1/23170/Bobra.0041s0021.1
MLGYRGFDWLNQILVPTFLQATSGRRALAYHGGPEVPSDPYTASYSNHHHLHLTPDDVWLAVAQGFSQHLDYKDNAEKYRKKFVTHEGKQTISYDSGVASPFNVDWNACVQFLSGEVGKRVVAAVDKIIQADFTTSTQVTVTAYRIVLLDAMKHYFEYKVMLSCGIPE